MHRRAVTVPALKRTNEGTRRFRGDTELDYFHRVPFGWHMAERSPVCGIPAGFLRKSNASAPTLALAPAPAPVAALPLALEMDAAAIRPISGDEHLVVAGSDSDEEELLLKGSRSRPCTSFSPPAQIAASNVAGPVPSPHLAASGPSALVVGTLVNVYLHKHKGWFAGRVVEVWRLIDGTKHRVLFDDGDLLWINFSYERFEVLGEVVETSSLLEVADGAPPERDAAEAEAYASVRVRHPKKGYQDEVDFDWNSSRRTSPYAVGGSAGYSNPRAQPEVEARREAEARSQVASDEDNAAGLESLTADEARAAAAAEGLELATSSSGETGFKGVVKHHDKYAARVGEDGKHRYLGSFATPEEAALCYARHIGAERAAAEAAEARVAVPQPLTADEARAAAASEGLELATSSSGETGFKGVVKHHDKYAARVTAVLPRSKRHLGSFATPEEAALCYARYVGAE